MAILKKKWCHGVLVGNSWANNWMTRRTHNTKSGSRDFQAERTTIPKTLGETRIGIFS